LSSHELVRYISTKTTVKMGSDAEKVLGYRVEARNGEPRSKTIIQKFINDETTNLKTVEKCLEDYPKKLKNLEEKRSDMRKAQKDMSRSDIANSSFKIARKITPEISNLEYQMKKLPKKRLAHYENLAKLRAELVGHLKRKAEEDAAGGGVAPPPIKKARTTTAVQPISVRRPTRNVNIRRETVWVPVAVVANVSTARTIAAPSSTPSSRSSASASNKRKAEDDDEPSAPARPRKVSKKATRVQALRAEFSPSPPPEESETGEDGPDDLDLGVSHISKKKRLNFNGLVNHHDSCFSGVVIQLLDAALEDKNLDELLGEHDDGLDTFDMSEKECRQFDKTIYHDAGPDRKLKSKQKNLRAAIKAAAKAGETEKVSTAKHLRSLLHDLREEYHGTADRNVSPYLFQSVMAFGHAEDADRANNDLSTRQEMSGDVQHDSFEYYQSVLNNLREDPHIADSNGLQGLFEVETKTQDVCENNVCDHESAHRTASNNYHNVNVPHGKGDQSADFRHMVTSSMKSRRDDACPKCGEQTLITKTTFTKLPDNLVMKINRTAFNERARRATKVATPVDLDISKPVELGEEKFEIAAVVRHDGDSITCGHYTIFRKLDGKWFLLNDKECTSKAENEVRDHRRNGKCAMLLLKKLKAEEAAK
jgi:hypothetical protein